MGFDVCVLAFSRWSGGVGLRGEVGNGREEREGFLRTFLLLFLMTFILSFFLSLLSSSLVVVMVKFLR